MDNADDRGSAAKRARQRANRSARLERDAQAAKAARLRSILLRALGVTTLIAALGIGGWAAFRPPPPPPEGTVAVADADVRTHVDDEVDYETPVPAAGEHDPVWQNCGIYDQPIRQEHALHSLEHGAVWLAYDAGLPAAEVETVRDVGDRGYVLVSPVEDLGAQVIASAWGNQLSVDDAADPRLGEFLDAFIEGPQTPEPGALCAGGIGEPGV